MMQGGISCAVLLVILITIEGIPQTKQPEPTIGPSLPDLTIAMAHVELETGNNCAYTTGEFGIALWIVNLGSTSAGRFNVEINGEIYPVPHGLSPQEQVRIWAPIDREMRVIVDSQAEVIEQNENNNIVIGQLPAAQRPASCTATPIVTITPVPVITNTPTPTSAPPQIAPQNLLPPDGAVVYLPFPTLSAERINLETVYEISNLEGMGIASLRSGPMGTILEYGPTALPVGVYQWSAYACRPLGCGPSSAPWTFTMGGTPMPTATPRPE
jgi:hypothetical protein